MMVQGASGAMASSEGGAHRRARPTKDSLHAPCMPGPQLPEGQWAPLPLAGWMGAGTRACAAPWHHIHRHMQPP